MSEHVRGQRAVRAEDGVELNRVSRNVYINVSGYGYVYGSISTDAFG